LLLIILLFAENHYGLVLPPQLVEGANQSPSPLLRGGRVYSKGPLFERPLKSRFPLPYPGRGEKLNIAAVIATEIFAGFK